MITEKPNILIVDDRPDGLLALEAVLDFPDCRLIPASGGHEALAIANSYPLALMPLDVQMPEMDGFECARRVKDIPHAKDVPIIFITAISKDMTNVYRGYESGAVDYLLKPFDPQVLRAKVAVFLDLFRKNQQLEFQSRQLLEAEQKAQSQKMAEIEIENLRRYRRLADAIPHIVMRVEPNGTGDYFNGTWKSFTGLTIDKSHGTGWHSAFDSVDLAAMLTAWSGAARNQDTFEYEVRIARADGMMRWHLVRGVSEDPSDPTGRWIFTCTDIHDRKESEEALNAQALDLARSNSDLQQFAYSASHDLQEPLRKITIFADLLRQTQGTNGDTSKWQSYLGKIQESATSMSDLVQGLLAYSRIHGKEEVLEAVDLNDIVASVLSNLEVSINAASASVRLNRMPVVKANRIW
ncbi:MAG: response regulator, partial [Elusimicrobia bacterium]|nr:response regulator [Elusimicrobiota bacterium]